MQDDAVSAAELQQRPLHRVEQWVELHLVDSWDDVGAWAYEQRGSLATAASRRRLIHTDRDRDRDRQTETGRGSVLIPGSSISSLRCAIVKFETPMERTFPAACSSCIALCSSARARTHTHTQRESERERERERKRERGQQQQTS